MPESPVLDNLPAQPTALIGRARETATLAALLRRPGVRLVTLTGPGGTGKTRLALAVAAALRATFPQGAWFVALAPIGDPRLVVPTVAGTLGLREPADGALLSHLKDDLREKTLLLVLDNFEQVAPAAPLVGVLLAAAASLKILVTSRTVLHIYGEHEFPVPPLALPPQAAGEQAPDLLLQSDAVRLFVERAQAVKPDFALTPENAPAVAAICARLDGLPLAIELAAARSKILSPAAMLARLPRGTPASLALLTGGAADLPARHQTLRAAIVWSYALLDPAEAALFRRLAVFVGGFTLEAADEVGRRPPAGGRDGPVGPAGVRNPEAGDLPAAPAPDSLQTAKRKTQNPALATLDGVASLVDKSLLRQQEMDDGEPRFAMLETVREFALEQLAISGEEAAVRRAHAAYFRALAEAAEPELRGPRQRTWLERLEREHDNLRAALDGAQDRGDGETALRLAGVLWAFWAQHGHPSEGRRRLEAALAASGGYPAHRAKALFGAGVLAFTQGDYARAEELLAASLAARRALADQAGIANTLNALGAVADALGRYPAARAFFEESLGIQRALGDKRGIAQALTNLGALALREGDLAHAIARLEESPALFRAVGDPRGSALALNNLAGLLLQQGDPARAGALLEDSLRLFRDLGDRQGIGIALNSLGDVARAAGDLPGATARYQESLQCYEGVGDRRGLATCLEGLAVVAATGGRPERATRLFAAADALRAAIGAPLLPIEQTEYGHYRAAARAALGEATGAAAEAAGRDLSRAEAIALAMQPLPPATPAPSPPGTSPPAKPAWNKLTADLTAREIEVLRLIAEGLTDAQVAERLVLSTRTVQGHVRSIYSKLDLTTRSAATRYAIEHGLI